MLRGLCHASAPLAFIFCSAGCGGSGDDAPSTPETTVSCTEDARLDSSSSEIDKTGELGVLSFRFFDLDPSPPAKGLNTFHLQATDASGALMDGELGVDLRMPDHGHGTSVVPIVSKDAGVYTVRQLFLFMPGVWRLEFEVMDAARGDAMLDRGVLHFCVEG